MGKGSSLMLTVVSSWNSISPPRASHPIIFWKSRTARGGAIFFGYRASDLNPSSLQEKENDSQRGGRWLGLSLTGQRVGIFFTQQKNKTGYSFCALLSRTCLFELGGLALLLFIEGPTDGLFLDTGQTMGGWLGLMTELDLAVLRTDLLVRRAASMSLEKDREDKFSILYSSLIPGGKL